MIDHKELGLQLKLGAFIKKQSLQTLWSGYGELQRLYFEDGSIIVKYVKLPQQSAHPKGWNTKRSHLRKLHSYHVETNWYQAFSKQPDPNCLIPQGLLSLQSEDEFMIVMQDLLTLGFHTPAKVASKTHLKTALSWLANFHAKYLNAKAEKLWEEGTYWHLQTRPDEFEAMAQGKLKHYAKQLDEALKNSSFQTLVHGDAKLANFCFNEHATACAAVDFQYVGQGCAMKDVIYFISSAVDAQESFEMQEWLLDVYFEAFRSAMKTYHPHRDAKALEREGRALYAIAWADFVRFLKGWSPTHYKINSYSEAMVNRAIDQLRSFDV